MKHIHNELLGAGLGMLVAFLVYMVSSNVQFSQMKGLIVDTSSNVAASGEVSVNDKSADQEALRRLAARANQIALQLQNSNQTVTRSVADRAVDDHADRNAWIQMRAVTRGLAAKHDRALQHAAAEPTTVAAITATEIPGVVAASPDPYTQENLDTVQGSDTQLPNSGPMLHLTLLAAFAGACVYQRKSVIAALERAI